jgi:formylglycine-generating enzyme required for sulfatase activity
MSAAMNAGVLPLIDKAWLWRRTRYATWRRIGPMMPGATPVGTLAGALAIAFGWEKADVRRYIEADDERALADWLCSRKPRDNPDDTAFLLAIDQFEELFTFADPNERRRFDGLLAAALLDHDCPLFVLSTVRSDFLDRFADDLPRLVAVRNGSAKLWTLPLISGEALREVITGPARLAGLNVGEVVEAMLDDAEGEPGALPLVENALEWLWWQPRKGNHLSGEHFRRQGKLGGILSNSADDLLDSLQPDERERALDLLLAMVRPNEDNRRHTRRRIAFTNAVRIAGGDRGHALIDRLQGRRILQGGRPEGPLRLITVTPNDADSESGGWVSLIHETLIRCKAGRDGGDPKPSWPTLWKHIENNRVQVLRRDHVLARAPIIEAAAIAWDQAGREETLRWEEEVLQVLREIREGGLSPHDVIRPGLSRAFFGPTDPPEIIEMFALTEADDGTRGSGRYGTLWRLPLGHQRRAVLADWLAIVGDPRRGVGLDANGLPEIDWVAIDGGEVTIEIRANPDDPNSKVVKRLTHSVAPFRIARYPVTVAQFQAFLDACHREGEWRLPAGFPVDLPPTYPPPKPRARYSNHPADSVSWLDASGFCHWLSRHLGFEVRLPTEFEWQQAATGGDPARTYPWGANWDPAQEPWRANTVESELGRSTAVGMYPAGASPAGVLDMAGTVWEWCLNLFEQPDVTKFSKSNDPRVLRGGSWGNDQDLARSADRLRNYPNRRSNYIGFRVVCSSPSPGS